MADNGPLPLVSIGMPVYNGSETLPMVIDSLLEQNYPHIELIISDNASTDQTSQICRNYAALDHRVAYYRSDRNRGAVWNFNRVLQLSKGKYFMWAAHDDLRSPSYLSKCVNAMEANDKAVLCQSHTRASIEGLSRPLYMATLASLAGISSPVRRFAEALNYLPATAVYGLLRTEAAKRVRPWGNYLATDVVFTLELSLQGDFIQVPEELFFYYGRARRRTPKEEYAALRPGNRLPWWYIPFLVLALQRAAGILHSPVSFLQKARLLGVLIRYETRTVTAKTALRMALMLGNKRCPKWIADVLDEPMFNNPNILYMMNESEVPVEHQRPSRQAFGARI